MTNEQMKKVAIGASVFALVSITLMLHRSATKHILITDAAGAPLDRGLTDNSYTLLIDKNVPQGKENTLIIPLPGSVSSDNILLEDGYLDHELRIYIDSREEGFYKDNPIVTDLDILEKAVCVSLNDSGSVCLDFQTDQLYVNESSLTESSTIEVKFSRPAEKYDHIVVVDPEDGNAPLDTALFLKGVADADQENGIKIYFTRLTQEPVDREKRLSLIKDSQADLLVELSAEDTDSQGKRGLTAYYNDKYFVRRMDNARFGDIMLRNCALKSGTDGLGVLPERPENEVLGTSKIPSTRINLEGDFGEKDIERLAQGVYSGILETFEVME
ncbi:N-acetylmuramoyl-L-alanine amidase [Butyrivibrio sp. AE2032]|uniref:N-acetylmuramoyl-L-alanine amidase n=1 Tax=Butyrivibrio sp. AE2032 TaxID=1458463 RepID=UPI00054DE1A7|nr:N-acetylmuramoyl-L-alanine amidase [Butyrivibrio sp. AE2032]